VLAIILTTQRGPLLGLVAASGVAMVLLCRLRYIAGAGMGALVVGLDYATFHTNGISLLHLDAIYGAITHFLTQRDSIRLIIWQHAFELIGQHPWRGYGLQAKFVMEGLPGAVNPHNLFISTLYYLGIGGLGLLLMPLAMAFVVSLNHRRNPYHQLCLILLVHAVVATFTNYGQVVKAPYALWTIYWLPIAMALARNTLKPDTQKLSVGHA
jgi:O-antigen ligase